MCVPVRLLVADCLDFSLPLSFGAAVGWEDDGDEWEEVHVLYYTLLSLSLSLSFAYNSPSLSLSPSPFSISFIPFPFSLSLSYSPPPIYPLMKEEVILRVPSGSFFFSLSLCPPPPDDGGEERGSAPASAAAQLLREEIRVALWVGFRFCFIYTYFSSYIFFSSLFLILIS